MPRRSGLVLTLAVALATLGVYFLVGGPWAAAIGYEFAGAANPLLGLGLLVLAVAALAWDGRRQTSVPHGTHGTHGAKRTHPSKPSNPSKASRDTMDPRGTVVLYTRQHCSLCDEARVVLATVAAETGHAVWEEDVDRDPGLTARYGDRVPVAVLFEGPEAAGEELFELAADVARLRARLARSA